MARYHPKHVAQAVHRCIHRVDELSEAVSLYWKLNPVRSPSKKGGRRLSHQFEAGLRRAFLKFDEYQFAKYSFDKGKSVKLRDVLRMVRPDLGSKLFHAINAGTLENPDTWEQRSFKGKMTAAQWEELIDAKKLGYLALLRNLRNMDQAGVSSRLICGMIEAGHGSRYVLPFRYVAAARAAPKFVNALDNALKDKIDQLPKLKGRTIVLVDVSSSMDAPLSSKSDLTRMDAACAVAALINASQLRIFSFSNTLSEISRPHRGMRCIDQIKNSQPHGGTFLGQAVGSLPTCDRLIVLTDEQSHDVVRAPKARAYMINVASAQNGVGYGEEWTHIDGFSEGVLRYISSIEEPSRTLREERDADSDDSPRRVRGWSSPLD
jgi:hypothetical protein